MTTGSEQRPRILLIGFGGVGTIASYTLEHLGRAEVCVVARKRSYDIISEKGYRIESISYGVVEKYQPTYITSSTKEAMEKYGPFDYIVITTKNIPDISPVVDMLEDCYHEESAIVLIQNGIGIETPIFKKYPHSMVISGVSLIGTTLYDSTVKHIQKDVIKFGPFINYNVDKQKQIDKCKAFVELYSNNNNDAELDLDVKFARWKKLVYNSCINTACALANLDIGRMEMFGGTETIIIPAMREVIAVAKSDGVIIPEDVIQSMLDVGKGVYYPPSMLMDVRNGAFIEHVNIIGNVVKFAGRNNVSIPTLTVMNNLLKLVQMRTSEAQGRFILPEKRPLPEDNYVIQFAF